MKHKKHIGLSCLFLALLTIMGCALWVVFTGLDQTKFLRTMDATISFSKDQIISYDNNISNDRVKSLVRLLDKTQVLSRNMAEYASFTQDDLDTFQSEQRLTGILVLDEGMDVERASAQADALLWQDVLSKPFIQDLLAHPEATYTEQTTVLGVAYDLAIVSRMDAPGLVLTYVKKEGAATENDAASLAGLFKNYPFEMGGLVAVCSEEAVISASDPALVGLSVSAFAEKYGNDFTPNGEGIFRVKDNGRVWYGRQESVGNNTLFALFPASRIFRDRLTAMALYAVLAVLALLVIGITHSNLEKATLQQSQKRLRIITAIGTAFSSMALIHLRNGESELLKVPEDTPINFGQNIYQKEKQLALIERLIDPEYRDEFLAFVDMSTIARRLEGKKSISITTRTTYGTWLMVIIVPQKADKQGKLEAVLMASRDITAEKEKELAQDRHLRNALSYAQHANRAKTNFLNSMSHDIRTPMNAIMGYTALATAHIDNQAQVLDYLQKIGTSSEHLLSLINDVLDMSRIESGAVKLDESRVHLPDIIRDLCSIVQGNLLAKGHELEIDAQNIVHEDVLADKLRLNQVLLNLVSNAIKFTPAGGKIQIRVNESPSSKPDCATYTFRVKDNGMGISREFQKDVFEAFAREETTTRSGIQGTGLGLAITKNIVDMIGGTIAVESEPGEGAEFIVTVDFKISGQSGEVPKAQQSVRAAIGTRCRHQGCKVLLVEDNALNSEIATTILTEAGLKVDVVSDGIDAVERMANASPEQYDVILMDIQMPKMDGYTATREIRTLSDNKKANIPILAMTANAFEEDKEKAFRAGMNGHIAKPIDVDTIMAALDSIFGENA